MNKLLILFSTCIVVSASAASTQTPCSTKAIAAATALYLLDNPTAVSPKISIKEVKTPNQNGAEPIEVWDIEFNNEPPYELVLLSGNTYNECQIGSITRPYLN